MTAKYTVRWKQYSARSWYCEIKNDACDYWSYVGSVVYLAASWPWTVLSPRRFHAMAGEYDGRFKTLGEAQEFVEDHGYWP